MNIRKHTAKEYGGRDGIIQVNGRPYFDYGLIKRSVKNADELKKCKLHLRQVHLYFMLWSLILLYEGIWCSLLPRRMGGGVELTPPPPMISKTVDSITFNFRRPLELSMRGRKLVELII